MHATAWSRKAIAARWNQAENMIHKTPTKNQRFKDSKNQNIVKDKNPKSLYETYEGRTRTQRQETKGRPATPNRRGATDHCQAAR